MKTVSKKVLAVASGGGHWVQLLRLAPAFDGHEVSYVTVDRRYQSQVGSSRFFVVQDATRWDRLRLIRLVVQLFVIMIRERPDVVVSTGAAPGYFALCFGKLLGARTIWLDSIANIEGLSMSGARVGRYADLWLTQWPQLAREGGPRYEGAVL